jgi:hypothetical protein
MTQGKLIKFAERELDKCLKLIKEKNQDYSNRTDALRNLKAVDELGLKAEWGILVRMLDKRSRIKNLRSQKARVVTEKAEDTLRDFIGYAVLLLALMKDHESK